MSEELLNAAVDAAHAGAEVLVRSFRGEARGLEAKAAHDWVSAADRESEAAILGVLRKRFPDHQILAEEGGLEGSPEAGCRWIVDPLDGTRNFLQGLPVFAISIAGQVDGQTRVAVVYDPSRRELFTALRGGGAFRNDSPLRVSSRPDLEDAYLATGFPFRARAALGEYLEVFRRIFSKAGSVRRCGAAALDLAHTAAGIYDGFWEFRLSPWDIAAGALLIEEAGGRVTNLDGGEEIFSGGNVVAGNPGVHRHLLEILRQVVDEDLLGRKMSPVAAVATDVG